MSLTGRDVWDAFVKLGLMSGLYHPRNNHFCLNAEKIAGVLNEGLTEYQGWLPHAFTTKDALRVWEANTPREYVLRLYKFLNTMGYTVVGIDAAIEREAQKRKATAMDVPVPAKRARP